jgi:IMP dehydrogenase/GMP reductase
MAFFIGRDREARRAYGFDEIALVPGDMTVNPDEVDTTLQIGDVKLEIPFLASAMDGVVDAEFAIAMGKLGGLGVLNLDGISTRYEKPREVVMQIAGATRRRLLDPAERRALRRHRAGSRRRPVRRPIHRLHRAPHLHRSTSPRPRRLHQEDEIPVVIGNAVTYSVVDSN